MLRHSNAHIRSTSPTAMVAKAKKGPFKRKVGIPITNDATVAMPIAMSMPNQGEIP
jgi:hypothetical protein